MAKEIKESDNGDFFITRKNSKTCEYEYWYNHLCGFVMLIHRKTKRIGTSGLSHTDESLICKINKTEFLEVADMIRKR